MLVHGVIPFMQCTMLKFHDILGEINFQGLHLMQIASSIGNQQ